MQSITKAPKPHYSEDEAALELGITVEQLRTLVREHILGREGGLDLAPAVYQASDLVILRFLAKTPQSASQVAHL